ncbi:MAG TPA: DUF2461 domain-containing protein [Candidatus Dormibacteraeota bacterium]|nr:DUF2461 domain-containing protein [Candidatus Dormibacteraeota bacterium]
MTALPFTGFTPAAIQFLADLAENNDRAWFQPRKAEFERLLKEPMEAMIAALADRLAVRKVPILADPKRAPFRIYRDTRFSKDKSPYKTHLGASFPWVEADPAIRAGGDHEERTHGNGGYFHFQPGEMYVGGGMWQMDKPRIDTFRAVLREDPGRVQAALEEPRFIAWFGGVHPHEELRRMPPGFPEDHPLAHMFRWKDVVFGRRLADDEVLSPDLPDRLAEGFATAIPAFRFLASLDPA